MIILGISAYYHDSAAALIKNGSILSAAQEERFTRKKHDENFPINAIKFCIKDNNLKFSDIDYVVFYDKPFLKFERLLETYLAFAPKGFLSFCKALPIWLKDKLFQKKVILKELYELDNNIDWKNKLLFSEHHLSHASSAFFPSPFKNAAILTMDGVGEWTTSSLAIGNANSIEIIKEIHFPHSIGLLYSAFTYYTGFKVNSGEYKLMGLAPYGSPKYKNKITENLITIAPDGTFHLDMSYFNYATGLTMTTKKFHHLFGGPPRKSESLITQKEMDIAASIQVVLEEIIIKLAKNIRKETKQKNLCLAGGVALNCVANGKLIKSKIFDHIWIQPASGDAGGAIGAALAASYLKLNIPRRVNKEDSMNGSYLGTEYSQDEIKRALKSKNAIFKTYQEKKLLKVASKYLSEGKTIGWMNGKMEFGPRALGGRSIIADPRSTKMQKKLNLKIKYRESFRPFAPSILEEDLRDWFDLDIKSPYMLLVADIKKNRQLKLSNKQQQLFGIERLNIPKSEIPAITHVDYSSRIQTVNSKTNPKFYGLLKEFKKLTGCPVLVNTSFNIRGEPIVCSPIDAFNCFMGCDLDILIIGNNLLLKEEQKTKKLFNYKDRYDLD